MFYSAVVLRELPTVALFQAMTWSMPLREEAVPKSRNVSGVSGEPPHDRLRTVTDSSRLCGSDCSCRTVEEGTKLSSWGVARLDSVPGLGQTGDTFPEANIRTDLLFFVSGTRGPNRFTQVTREFILFPDFSPIFDLLGRHFCVGYFRRELWYWSSKSGASPKSRPQFF